MKHQNVFSVLFDEKQEILQCFPKETLDLENKIGFYKTLILLAKANFSLI